MDEGEISDRMKAILALTEHLHGHWEDPSWGRRHSEIMSHLAIYVLAENIKDTKTRAKIQKTSEKNIKTILK